MLKMSLNETPLMKATTADIAVDKFLINLYNQKKREIFCLLGQ